MFDPWVRKFCWRRKWQSTPVILPGEFHKQRSLAVYSPWDRKQSDWATFTSIHFNSCVVIFHCYFNLHFPSGTDVKHLFICYLPPVYFLMLYLLMSLTVFLKSGCPFYYWVLKFLCLFWVTVLFEVYLLHIISPYAWFVLILLTLFFVE